MRKPTREQIDAIASKIFLTSQDSLGKLTPDYWRSCIQGGVKGTDQNCAFAAEVLSVPGVAASGAGDDSEPSGAGPGIIDLGSRGSRASPVAKGIKPPRVAYQHEPEFSEPARVARYQGTIVLAVVVSKEGSPTNIRITQPLGYGLDVKAVKAVEGWKFTPAEKDGEPVPVQVAIEVDFHLLRRP